MDLEPLTHITDESKLVSAIYEIFDENSRLNRSRSARVEFLTTVKYIEEGILPNAKILDLGAGAGEYSFHFANKGHSVTAVELAAKNVQAFQKKLDLSPAPNIRLIQGNALDLSDFDHESFDIVLLLGPLYHLKNAVDRNRVLQESMRVLKNDGRLFVAFINNSMIPLTESVYNPEYLKGDSYDHDTFKVKDFPFVFFDIDDCRAMLRENKVRILKEIASDGFSELLAEHIDHFDEESYQQYLKYHFHHCEKKESLSATNHFLFVCEKNL